MRVLKNAVIRTAALLLFLSFVCALILYQTGVYDISFIKRPVSDETMQTSKEETSAETTETTSEEDSTSVSIPDNTEENGFEEILNSIKDLSSLDGYKISYNRFSSMSVLARLDYDMLSDSTFSLGTYDETLTVMYYQSNGKMNTRKEITTYDRPRISLYFGYIFVHDGNSYDIYSSGGKRIYKDFKGSAVNALSKDNRPVIKDEKDRYYAIAESGLSKIEYKDIDFKSVTFDHPRYYGESNINLTVFSSNTERLTYVSDVTDPSQTAGEGYRITDGKLYKVENVLLYGYKDKSGNVKIEPQFASAYPFSKEGLAAVTDEEGSLFFIDTSGKEKASLRKNKYVYVPEFNNNKYLQVYQTGLNDTLSDLGMYYYDEGYVMVRYTLKGSWAVYYTYKNENILIDTSGNTVNIPGNYELKNYSDGIMLLYKNGKYGYMRPDLSWVSPAVFDSAQPFIQGLAVVESNGKYGMMDTEANMVLPICFDYISNVSSGVIAAYSQDNGWQLFAVAEK